MFFTLKKVISYIFMPMPLCFALLFIGCLLCWFKSYSKLGKLIFSVGLCLLLILSNTTISTMLIKPLEYRFPPIVLKTQKEAPYELKNCKYIVVLGSSNSEDLDRSALSRLSSSGLSRLTEALRIAKALPQAKIIVSGPAYDGYPSHAHVLISAANELNFNEDRFIKIETAKDTEDESFEIKKIVGSNQVVLVTSAWHMPRAMLLFHHQGIKTVACPTDYSTRLYAPNKEIDFSQINSSLWRSTWAIHEQLGLLWLKFKYSLHSGNNHVE